MERILSHRMNLDQREPTLKIVCPKPLQDIAKPTHGKVNDGCPNLLCGYDPGEYVNHWQFRVPGQPKGPKYFPGDQIPGCKDGKIF
jgi:hypothetical protein